MPEDRDHLGTRLRQRGARRTEVCNHNAAVFEIVAVGAGMVGGKVLNTIESMPAIHAAEVAGEMKFGTRQDA